MQKDNPPKNFGGTILVIVLFFLFACSFTNHRGQHNTGKPVTEAAAGFPQNHWAMVSGNHIFDSASIFVKVIKKYPDRSNEVLKKLNENRLIGRKFAILQKSEHSSAPAPLLSFYFQYQYHSQKADDNPAIG